MSTPRPSVPWLRAVGQPAPVLSWRRRLAGAFLLLAGMPLLTAALLPHRADATYATPVLLMLLVVVASSLVGGMWVAIPGAVAGALLLNWFFTRPFGTLTVERADQLLVLAVYLTVAIAVSVVAGLASKLAMQARLARAEAEGLSALAGEALSKQETLPRVLERTRDVFGMREASLLELQDDDWHTVESVSTSQPHTDDERETQIDAGPGLALRLRGPDMVARDERVLRSFADAAATAFEGRRLAQRAAEGAAFEAADRTRIALLAGVGHDLRTPLAALKAAAGSLRQTDVNWTPQESDELLATIEESADRLHALVENLLDASRLQAGVVSAQVHQVGLFEVVDRALASLAARDRVHVDIPENLPDLLADDGLLERVLVNVLANATRYSPAGTIVTVRGTSRNGTVRCEIVDHGPGLPAEQRVRMFAPFQRLGDRGPSGIGLGLSVARGLTEAMDGALTPHDTEGGGLTLRLTLPAVPQPHS